MKTNQKILISLLICMFVFVAGVSAVGPNGDAGNQIQQNQEAQLQVNNQGSTIEVKTQTTEQVQQQENTVNQVGPGTGQQVQQQTQQQLRDGSGDRNQVENNNQGENVQVQVQQQSSEQNKGSEMSQQRRSKVANAVQQMLQVADRNGGIGQQVRVIAQEQNQSINQAEESLSKVENRNGFVKFLIGPNYGEINKSEKLLEQNREKIEQLNQIKTQLPNQGDHQMLTQQIQVLEQANLEIENTLKNSQQGISLLGWMFKFFSK